MKKLLLIMMFFIVIVLSSCTPPWIKDFGDYVGYSWESESLDVAIKWETIDDEYSVYMYYNTDGSQTVYLAAYRSDHLTITKNTSPLSSKNDVFISNYKFSDNGSKLKLYSITLDKLWKYEFETITLMKKD